MDRRLATRFAFWPTVMTATAAIVLVGLGGWQLYRLDWKLGLIAEIESRATRPAVPLPAGPIDADVWIPMFNPRTTGAALDYVQGAIDGALSA